MNAADRAIPISEGGIAMSVEAMRSYISKMYISDRWHRKVINMPDRQVIAIYRTMKARGQQPPKRKDNEPLCEQLNMFDMMLKEN